MKAFNHTNAKTLAEAKTALAGGKANHDCRRHRSHRYAQGQRPSHLPRDLDQHQDHRPGLDYIKEEAGMLKIGATTRLADIAANPVVNQKYTALAQAAFAGGARLTSGTWAPSAAISPSCTAAGISANRKTASTASARAGPPALP